MLEVARAIPHAAGGHAGNCSEVAMLQPEATRTLRTLTLSLFQQ